MIAQFTRGAKPVELIQHNGVQCVKTGGEPIPCPADPVETWGTWDEYHAAQRRVMVVEE